MSNPRAAVGRDWGKFVRRNQKKNIYIYKKKGKEEEKEGKGGEKGLGMGFEGRKTGGNSE